MNPEFKRSPSSARPVPKNLPLVVMLGQMGFRLCLLGLIGFLCALVVQLWLGFDSRSYSLTYQLLIACWGFAAAGGMMFVGCQFLSGPFKQRKPKRGIDLAKETAYQLALLGSRYRVFNGVDLVTEKGQVQSYPHLAVGPNGVFYLAAVEEMRHAQQVLLQDLLWGKNIRNVEIHGITLPIPRLAQTVQQLRTKRRLSQDDVGRIAGILEGCSRPSKKLKDGREVSSPLVWMVPVVLFVVVVGSVVLGSSLV